tara:strand:+ start:163 stop:291 length:129 start_codon:yes stop_codon:yes gene_type:complete
MEWAVLFAAAVAHHRAANRRDVSHANVPPQQENPSSNDRNTR